MKPIILLVDDEPELLGLFAEALGAAMPAYDVQTQTSYESALTVIDGLRDELRLVVVDHLLGRRTGLDLLTRLRNSHPQTQGILFTGDASVAVEASARACGAQVVCKPVRLKAWLSTIEATLQPQV